MWSGVRRAIPALLVTLSGLWLGISLVALPLLTDAMLRDGKVTVVNFWASWCPPCRAEHPVLKEMAANGIRVAGINMMDDEEKAAAYLAEDGNPFFALATDPKGRNRVETVG